MGVSLVSWQSMVTVAGASPQTAEFIPLWPCRKKDIQVGSSAQGRGMGCRMVTGNRCLSSKTTGIIKSHKCHRRAGSTHEVE